MDTVRLLGLRGIQDMNPDAQHPCMPAAGDEAPSIYVLSWAVSQTEDEEGLPLQGKGGALIRKALGCLSWRASQCVRTLPPALAKQARQATFFDSNEKAAALAAGRSVPTQAQVEGFRQSVVDDIEKSKPWAILALGGQVANWCLGTSSLLEAMRGKRFPQRFGEHVCWVYPVQDPEFFIHVEREWGEDKWAHILRLDMQKLVMAAKAEESAKVDATDKTALAKNTTVYHEGTQASVDAACAALAAWSGKDCYCDIETTMGRPYASDAKLYSISWGDWKDAHAVALDHPASVWSPRQLKQLREAIKAFLLSKGRKIFHNMSFDLEWLAHSTQFGCEMAHAAMRYKWGDTMAAAYLLNNTSGGMSLDFNCRQYFGVPLKSLSQVDRTALHKSTLKDMLTYNALDTRYTHKLDRALAKELEREGMVHVYEFHIQRIPVLVQAQLEGLRVNGEVLAGLEATWRGQHKTHLDALLATKEVMAFRRIHGPFNHASNKDLGILFADQLGIIERDEKGKATVDEKSLRDSENPAAKALLAWRKVDKILTTYVQPLTDNGEGASVIWPDGRLHTSFTHTRTGTGRLSSESPNMQNFPKRGGDGKLVRQAILPDPGHVLVACDYGQIEARIIGIASADPFMLKALLTDYDIHMEWAKKLAKADKRGFERKYGHFNDEKKALKAFRGDVKNQWVFPAIYGAGCSSIARALGCDKNILEGLFKEFWKTFAGIDSWKKETTKFYEKNGYVETLTGRRRQGPMISTEFLNSPIQGTASDVVVDAMVRLAHKGVKQKKPWLQARLNIHDDLTFSIPKTELPEALVDIVTSMVNVPFNWVTAPMSVECSIGEDWLTMEDVIKADTRNYQEVLLNTKLKPEWTA